MKGTVKVLNASGHSTVEFDTELGIVKEAEDIIRDAWANSSMLFDQQTQERIQTPRTPLKDKRPGKVLEAHEDIIVVAPMAGG